MNKIVLKLLSVALCLALLASFALIAPLSVSAADFYKDYTTIKVVKNQLDCYSMQGCDSDDTYIYCAKIKGTEDKTINRKLHHLPRRRQDVHLHQPPQNS